MIDPEVIKVINKLKKRMNEMEQKLEAFLLEKHEVNADAIAVSEEALLEIAGMVAEMSEAGADKEA